MAEQTVDNIEHPLNPLVQEWLRKLKIARDHKWEVFGKYAKEATDFFDGPHDFMWKEEYASGSNGFLDKDGSSHLPTFRMTVNKLFEAVALYGPALFHKYPEVTVSASTPPMIPPEVLGIDINNPLAVEQYQSYLAQDQFHGSLRSTHASLLQHYLNWLQLEGKKKTAARQAISEAIVKGGGLLWTELTSPDGSNIRYPISSFVSYDHLLKDPDASYHEDVQWCSRDRVLPVNKAARLFGLDVRELRGHLQSYASQSTQRGISDRRSKKDASKAHSYDLLKFTEIYSKNGFGHRLQTTQGKSRLQEHFNLDVFGDYCYIVVAEGIPFPLNFPSYALAEDVEEQFRRAQWPIPFWTDGGWPFSELAFYDKMNCIYPLGMFKPVIGELRFINWCMSFLADKVAAASTTYVSVAKAAGYEIQTQLQSGLAPFTVVEISDIMGKSVRDVIDFLQAPNFSVDIWNMVAQVMELIDKRTGLTELIYGLTGTQMRSATEADVRSANLAVRPDDMAERTEDWYSATAMKEAEAMVWALEGKDVQPILGDTGATVFEQQIQGQDYERIVRDYTYRIQAGSARKPNKANRLRSLNEWGQVAMPMLQMFAQSGIVEPWNAFAEDVAKAMDLDARRYLVEMPQQEEAGPSEQELEEEKHEQEMLHAEEKHDQEIEHTEEKNRLEIALKRKQLTND